MYDCLENLIYIQPYQVIGFKLQNTLIRFLNIPVQKYAERSRHILCPATCPALSPRPLHTQSLVES